MRHHNVDPISSARASRPSREPALSPLSWALACALGSVWVPALANPAGGQVVSGAATINTVPGLTTINQTSQNSIINWPSFSIQAGERTRFNQPSASSATLNRVLGGNPSAIMGNLSANGKIFLINPNGVLVGPSGSVQTGAFVASTRDVSNVQFLQGGALDLIGNSTTSIVNLGSINATSGDVHLIAHKVDNQGSITAPNGRVGFASGTQVLLNPASSERLWIRPQGFADGASVSNSGQIAAVQVELKAAGGNPFALAVNAGGNITAVGLEQSGGRILLKSIQGKTQVSGTLTASQGDKGGEIQVLGNQVALTSTANLQASGEAGGGTLLVGGDYQGKNVEVQNAKNTFVEAGARLSADATVKGDGGKIMVWSDETTTYRGTGSARGGADGGNGGFAEVSGKQALAYTGTVDLRAPQGLAGTLLLDPTDITIFNSTPSGSLAVMGDATLLTLSDIQTALGLGNVVISTTSGGGGAGDIKFVKVASVGDPTLGYFFNTPNRLTLLAERDIIVNERVQVTNNAGLGEMVLQAGRNLTVNNHGLGFDTFSQVFLNAPKLTLISDANNSGNGTGRMTFANNVRLFSDNLRLFVPSTDQLERPDSVTLTNTVPTVGKWLGDAGTSAEGIYARRAATTSPVPPGVGPITLPIQTPIVLDVREINLRNERVRTLGNRSLDDVVLASGDEALIRALAILNIAKERLKANPADEEAKKAAQATEEAILKRLPEFDRFQQTRLTDAQRLNDQQVNIWLNNIAALEAYVNKFGRDASTTNSIVELKAKVDARMTGIETRKVMADVLQSYDPNNLVVRFHLNLIEDFLSKNTERGLSATEAAQLNNSLALFAMSTTYLSNKISSANSRQIDALDQRISQARADIKALDDRAAAQNGQISLMSAVTNYRSEGIELSDAYKSAYANLDKLNVEKYQLLAKDNPELAKYASQLEQLAQIREKLNSGRYKPEWSIS